MCNTRFSASAERILQRRSAGIHSDVVGTFVVDLGRQSEQKFDRERLGDNEGAADRSEEIHQVRHFDSGLQQYSQRANQLSHRWYYSRRRYSRAEEQRDAARKTQDIHVKLHIYLYSTGNAADSSDVRSVIFAKCQSVVDCPAASPARRNYRRIQSLLQAGAY